MTDNQQILRLLATIREEVADIRSRQEELYELLISYKDQIHEVKRTVEQGLDGLPRSPYIAGQLVPAPTQVDEVDEFGQMLATYLHKHVPWVEPTPRDVTIEPAREGNPDEVQLEPGDPADRPRRGGRGGGGGRKGGGGGVGRDSDLERGPDRGVMPLDLDDDEDDDDGDDDGDGDGDKKKKRRRRRRGKKRGSESSA